MTETASPASDLTQDQMDTLHDDREAVFQFTKEEKNAWKASNFGQKVLSKELMEEIEIARQQLYEHEQQQKQEFIASLSSSSPTPTTTRISNNNHHDEHHESFSHITKDGTTIHMVDVGHKQVTTRMAKAQTKVILPDDVLHAFGNGSSSLSSGELIGPKGPIFATAKLAGIMAAK